MVILIGHIICIVATILFIKYMVRAFIEEDLKRLGYNVIIKYNTFWLVYDVKSRLVYTFTPRYPYGFTPFYSKDGNLVTYEEFEEENK